MALCMYDEHDRQRRKAAHAAYMAAPGFQALEVEAFKRGFRKATVSEINASAEQAAWAPDLFCWRGGLWVKAQGGAA